MVDNISNVFILILSLFQLYSDLIQSDYLALIFVYHSSAHLNNLNIGQYREKTLRNIGWDRQPMFRSLLSKNVHYFIYLMTGIG